MIRLEPIQGADSVEIPAEVQTVLAELPQAMEYGLYGLQVWATGQANLMVISYATEALLAVLEEAAKQGPLGEAGDRLLRRMREDWTELARQQITEAYDRDIHMIAYADSYERARGASLSPMGKPTFAAHLLPREARASDGETVAALRAALAAQLSDGALANVDRIADVLMRYCRDEQGILANTGEILHAINKLLDRPEPQRPLTFRDFFVYYGMRDAKIVYLLASIEEELGIHIECTAAAVEVQVASRAEPLAG